MDGRTDGRTDGRKFSVWSRGFHFPLYFPCNSQQNIEGSACVSCVWPLRCHVPQYTPIHGLIWLQLLSVSVFRAATQETDLICMNCSKITYQAKQQSHQRFPRNSVATVYLENTLTVSLHPRYKGLCVRMLLCSYTEHHTSRAHNFFNLSKMSCASSSIWASVLPPPLLSSFLCRFLEGGTGWSSSGMLTALCCWSIMVWASIIFCTGIFVRVLERIKSTGRAGRRRKDYLVLISSWNFKLAEMSHIFRNIYFRFKRKLVAFLKTQGLCIL